MSEFLTWNIMPRDIASPNSFTVVIAILETLVKLCVASVVILFVAIVVDWIVNRYFTVTENDEVCDQDPI